MRRTICSAWLLFAAVSTAASGQATPTGPTPQVAPAAPSVPAAVADKKGRPEQCAACHAGLPASRLRVPAELLGGRDVHGKQGLSCSACHSGDAAAKDAKAAHGAPGFLVRPVGQEATAVTCGRCHTAAQENFLKSPHHVAKDHAKRPDCITCHGAHGIAQASIALIADPLCSQCHTIGQARRVLKAVEDAEKNVATLDQQLAFFGDKKGRERLHEARSQLRGLAHSLDILAITRNAGNVEKVVDEVKAKALPLRGALLWAEDLRSIALVVSVLFAIALGVVIGGFVWRRRHHLPAFAAPKSRTLKLLGLGALGLVVASLIGAKRGYDYIEHDPKFCTSCHTMGSAYDLWDKSAHKNIQCHTCHLADPIDNLHQLWVYSTRRPDEVVKHAEVDRAICLKCHQGEGAASKWNNIVATPGHALHAGKNQIQCTQCHAQNVHRFVPQADVCTICHKSVTLKTAGTMAEMHCLQCHNFKVADPSKGLRPDRAACLECHEQRKIVDETFPTGKAPMKWDCGKCHKPHEKIAIASDDCKKCHLAADAGIHKAKAHQNCLDCHRPHSWTSAPASCATCHKGKEEHNPGKACSSCHGPEDPE